MFVPLSLCLPVPLFTCISLCLLISLSVSLCLFFLYILYISVSFSAPQSLCLFVYFSVCPYLYPLICLSVSLSRCLSVCRCAYYANKCSVSSSCFFFCCWGGAGCSFTLHGPHTNVAFVVAALPVCHMLWLQCPVKRHLMCFIFTFERLIFFSPPHHTDNCTMRASLAAAAHSTHTYTQKERGR